MDDSTTPVKKTIDAFEQKTFSYTLKNVQLTFSIRTDIQNDMRLFREILLTALGDIEEHIKKINV